jgi:Na+-driven multidrug efflux pump
MFQYFVSHAGWFLFFIIIEQSGERALAISVVIRIIYMFQMVPFWGFSSATNTLVSFVIGEGNPQLVIPILRRITLLSVLGAAVFIIPNLLIPEWVIGLAVENKDAAGLVTQSIPTLYVISLALFLFGLAMTWYSGVSGSGNTRTALLIETVAIAFYLIVAWFLGIYLQTEVHIIWLTEPFYFLMMGLISYLYMRSDRWKARVSI